MKRTFWLALGIGVGVAGAYAAARKVNELKQSNRPVALAAAAVDKARDGSLPTAKSWRAEFAQTKADREAELRDALGMPDSEQVEAARERREAAKVERIERGDGGGRAGRRSRGEGGGRSRGAPGGARPGGLRPEDLDDPLYEF